MDKITWAPHIPLIGGLPIGAEVAIGHAPEEIFSLPGFSGNDQHYVNFQQATLGRSYLKYTPIEPDDLAFDRKINIIVGTPPCAALSQLNTGSRPEAKGAGCAKNDFMMMVFKHGIYKFHADVIIVENAPALSTTKGAPVAEALNDICKEAGYSFTLYKTSTHFHGIPQRRDRTFAIAWRSEFAPVMDYERVDSLNFKEYLDLIPEDATMSDVIVNEKLLQDGYWNYIKETMGDPRKLLLESGESTCFGYVSSTPGGLEKCAEWLREHGDERSIRLVEHAMAKIANGKGIWDGSVHVFGDKMNAVIGRNLADTVHPSKDRSLTVREAMHMMGLPHNFELLGGKKNVNHIAQNVPTCTAKFITEQAVKFIRGELPMSDSRYIKQDNWNGRFEYREEPAKVTLDEM